MSQNDLALESGVAPSTISYIECGHSTASVWVLAHICDALGVSMQWMVYGRGRK
nr:MAG TPA: helix-turn-helix domain protein [Podoviridae sp. ctDgT26]DAN82290.1 MAG TPA: helix-turn-helix domain protein [Caudoviricetes sp.]